MNNYPIGIFDSGVGGISIWKEINQRMPNEDTVYLADSANAPYGQKSREQILQLSRKNTELLLQQGCKLIVVACNTATTNAIAYLRDHYAVPFIGIEPAIKPAALLSKSKTIGILATKGTLSSSLFSTTSKHHASGIQIIEQEGTGLVELIESGDSASAETKKLLASYVQPMLDAQIDHLVLGCTHYPYLIPLLKELMPKEVQIIDCGAAVAKQTYTILNEQGLLNADLEHAGAHRFYTNTDVELLTTFLKGLPGNIHASYKDF
ncbi:MAG: glutamate racemase [Eudoraea sp.]|nr:glutamate racemase [Eudoraea sp.]